MSQAIVSIQHRQPSDQGLDERRRPATYFDSPARSSPAAVGRMADRLARTALVKDLLEAYPTPAVMLDEHRQIVAFNQRCLPFFDRRDPPTVYGLRFGEALECVHAHEMDAGCGTSPFCRDCGAAAAIRIAREARRASALECRITASRHGKPIAFDLRVHASPITIHGRHLVLAAIQDIADEKRRQALEQIFFHDVLNTASAISCIAWRLSSLAEPDRLEDLAHSLTRSSSQLLDEIRAQRDLVNAEQQELVLTPEAVSANWLLSTIHDIYAVSPAAEGKRIVLDALRPDVEVWTDAVQATRCVGNLVKNALEASAPGGEVRLSSKVRGGTVAFDVRNAGVLSDQVRRQIFQRSFSTKGGRGRGIGTYSVKLLVEQYLGGTVSFTSDPERQTVFTIQLPRAAANGVDGGVRPALPSGVTA
jgi:signal transduction histidine kinase